MVTPVVLPALQALLQRGAQLVEVLPHDTASSCDTASSAVSATAA